MISNFQIFFTAFKPDKQLSKITAPGYKIEVLPSGILGISRPFILSSDRHIVCNDATKITIKIVEKLLLTISPAISILRR